MFILMPFVCPEGGWEEAQESGTEIRLCEGWRFPFKQDNPMNTRLLYSGAFSALNKNFEDESPLWRVQTQKFDNDMWHWFLSPEMNRRRKLHNCRYIDDGNDVIPTHPHLAKEFAFPMWVIDALIADGTIKHNSNLLPLIEARRKMEEGTTAPTFEASAKGSVKEEQEKKKAQKAKDAVSEMQSFVDPKKELKKEIKV